MCLSPFSSKCCCKQQVFGPKNTHCATVHCACRHITHTIHFDWQALYHKLTMLCGKEFLNSLSTMMDIFSFVFTYKILQISMLSRKRNKHVQVTFTCINYHTNNETGTSSSTVQAIKFLFHMKCTQCIIFRIKQPLVYHTIHIL